MPASKTINKKFFIPLLVLFSIGLLIFISYDAPVGGFIFIAALIGMMKDLITVFSQLFKKDSTGPREFSPELNLSNSRTGHIIQVRSEQGNTYIDARGDSHPIEKKPKLRIRSFYMFERYWFPVRIFYVFCVSFRLHSCPNTMKLRKFVRYCNHLVRFNKPASCRIPHLLAVYQ